MGALIGVAIQLAFLAIGLTITLLIWTVRLMLMLAAAVVVIARGLRRPSTRAS
jgi:hypothetical protein